MNNEAKKELLYTKSIEGLSTEQIANMWPANTKRCYLFTDAFADEEINQHIYAISAAYKTDVAGTDNESGLNEGDDLTIYIKGLDINTAEYSDLRFCFDYFTQNSSASIIKTDGFELYVKDEKGALHGPYRIEDSYPAGFYKRKSDNVCLRRYDVITQSLKDDADILIKELVIKPFGNIPKRSDPAIMLENDWRQSSWLQFQVSYMNITGYKNSYYKRRDFISFKAIDVDKIRVKAAQRMYALASTAWSPSADFTEVRVVGSNRSQARTSFKTGKKYYGSPYSQRNRVTVEKFRSVIKDGILQVPDNTAEVCGCDCAASVTYSVSKFIEIPDITNTTDFIWNRRITTVLGDIKIYGSDVSSFSILKYNSPRKIFEGYAQLKMGDIVSRHNENTHVMLLTGSTRVVREKDGRINPEKSYIIRSDIRTRPVDTEDINNIGGLVDENDTVAPYHPDLRFTDITDFSQLKGQNTNFYRNTKTSFTTLLSEGYLPLRFNAFIKGEAEVPYAHIVNPNTKGDLVNGLKGTVVTNYTIIAVNFYVENKTTGKKANFTDYPGRSSDTSEGMFASFYSLYHNTPERIKQGIAEVIKGGDFEFKINVTAGDGDDITALKL